MRNARSIAAGASSEMRKPKKVLISRLKLMSPRPIVTGSISSRTRRIRGSRQSKLMLIGTWSRCSTGTAIANWHAVPASTPIAYA